MQKRGNGRANAAIQLSHRSGMTDSSQTNSYHPSGFMKRFVYYYDIFLMARLGPTQQKNGPDFAVPTRYIRTSPQVHEIPHRSTPKTPATYHLESPSQQVPQKKQSPPVLAGSSSIIKRARVVSYGAFEQEFEENYDVFLPSEDEDLSHQQHHGAHQPDRRFASRPRQQCYPQQPQLQRQTPTRRNERQRGEEYGYDEDADQTTEFDQGGHESEFYHQQLNGTYPLTQETTNACNDEPSHDLNGYESKRRLCNRDS
jgi:hypothetical protein